MNEIEQTFRRLADDWRRESAPSSSDHDIILHRAYQEIIGLGQGALPLILRELQRESGHWFWALEVIARESPVPPSEAGKVRLMRQRWLDWGRRKGYIE